MRGAGRGRGGGGAGGGGERRRGGSGGEGWAAGRARRRGRAAAAGARAGGSREPAGAAPASAAPAMDPCPKDGESAAAGEPGRGAAPSSGVVVQVREKKGPLRAAIPYMPFPVAVICLFLNTFVPGLGKELRSRGRGGSAQPERWRVPLLSPGRRVSVRSRPGSRTGRHRGGNFPRRRRGDSGRDGACLCAPAESFAAGAGSGRLRRGVPGERPGGESLGRPAGQRPRTAEGTRAVRAPPRPSPLLGAAAGGAPRPRRDGVCFAGSRRGRVPGARGTRTPPASAAGRASLCDSARQRLVSGLSIPALSHPSVPFRRGTARRWQPWSLGAGLHSGVRALASCHCSQRTKSQSARIAHQRRTVFRAHLPEFPTAITEKPWSCTTTLRNRCREKLGIQFLNTKSLASGSGSTSLSCGCNPFYISLSPFLIRKCLLQLGHGV